MINWNKRLGLPYMGSKNRIGKKLIDVLPAGNRFVDLFAGGCAMTHAAMLSQKYNEYLINDWNDFVGPFFLEAIQGIETDDWSHFYSREEFFAMRDTSPFVSCVYSFGGHGSRTYAYSPAKMQREQDYFYGRLTAKEAHKDTRIRVRVEGIRRLRQLKAFAPQCKTSVFDYRKYEYQHGDVVYCDPPYSNTARYCIDHNIRFNTDVFWDWVRSRDYPVYVSEQIAPADFKSIWAKEINNIMCVFKSRLILSENLFVHEKYYSAFL